MSEIYALSDDALSPDDVILDHAEQILKSGVKFYQYRTKKHPKNEKIARELLSLCKNFQATFIVNDDVGFAKRIGTNAVHIGKDDGSLAYAREILGKNALIGVSCYDDISLAIKAQEQGADYVAFGAVFPSKTKLDTVQVGLETLKKAKQILSIPVCAIGGINSSNIAEISKLQIDYIAVVRALYEPFDIACNIKNLQSNIKYI